MIWPQHSIREICDVQRGTSITQSKTRPGYIPVVAGGITPTYFHDLANRPAGVITISASGANAGYVNFWDCPIFASDCSTVVSVRTDVDIRFVYHFLRSKQSFINSKLRSGAAQPHVYAKDIAQLCIPLPRLPEQRRIAAILDQTDALRANRREALTQLDSFTQSIFIDMFGDPISNPKKWATCTLESVCKKITDGTHKTPTYVESGIEFLSAKDLKNERIEWGSQKFITKEEHKQLIKRCNPELGDVLLAKSGSLGAVAVIDRGHEFSLFESLCLIKHDRSQICAEFLTGLLRAPSMLSHLLGKNKGIAIKHLHLIDVRNLVIPLPPIRLQREYTMRINAVGMIRKNADETLLQLNNLFDSLQHRAFRGEL